MRDLELAKKIRVAAGFGLSTEQIAAVTGLTKQQVSRFYEEDVRYGQAHVVYSVSQQLFADATSPSYIRRVDSQKLILTNLHNFSEKVSNKVSGDADAPLIPASTPLDPQLLAALEALRPK